MVAKPKKRQRHKVDHRAQRAKNNAVSRESVSSEENAAVSDMVSWSQMTAQLGDGRLNTSQRQTVAGQIGKTAGNQVLQRVLAGRAVTRAVPAVVQRWGSAEHMALGDVTGIQIDIGDGVQLSFGQVMALAGDEFGTLEELMAATKTADGRAMIRAHLEQAEIPGTAASMLPAPTPAQKEKASGEYVALAMENTTHFAGGGTAVENWLQKHAEAIELAMQAGLYRDPSLLNQAYFTEAFGQHFLTDSFSSGHIRVPREDIRNYYVDTFAPQIFDHLIEELRDRLIDEIYDQIDDQTIVNEAAYGLGLLGGLGLRAYIRGEIRDDINARLDEAFTQAGGRAEAVKYVGLGLAGVVSGAMHDMENRQGLWVINDFNPVPWQAYGDGSLAAIDNRPHRQQAEEAVRASAADLQLAYEIGLEEGQELYNVPEPDWVPDIVYFGFDKDALSSQAADAVDMIALYLKYHPSTRVALYGHADPIGDDIYNEDLGSRRAHSVTARLLANGVDASRLEVESMGEKQPVTTSYNDYHRNRRVEFVYSTDATIPDDGPDQVALENARQALLNQVGPPYVAEGYLPRAAAGMNAELPDYQWGAIPASFRTEMADWIKHYANSYGDKALAAEALNDVTKDTAIGEFTISPRPVARRLLGEITADPVGFLENMFGRNAGP